MSKTIEEYKALFTSQYQNSPKMLAWAEKCLTVLNDGSTNVDSFTLGFDLDTAIGAQLDILGIIIGIDRELVTPLQNVFFGWDTPPGSPPEWLGWDAGIWYDESESGSTLELTKLPDEHFRMLLKAKVAANQWDGTVEGMQEAYSFIYSTTPDKYVIIIDNQDMSMTVVFLDPNIDVVTEAIITGGYLPLKPEGVKVNYTLGGPFFAWDTAPTGTYAGWEAAYWLKES